MSPRLDSPRLDRREFVGLTAASLSAAWLAACSRDLVSPADAPRLARGTSTRNPLRIPSVVSPTGLTLTAAPGTADLGGGQRSTAWMYNGQFPGPTIVANKGGAATIGFVNGLSQESITHWHGMIVDYADDGHPRQAVPPGG